MFTLKVKTSNAATQSNEDLAEILRRYADRLELGVVAEANSVAYIYDVNGNDVGSMSRTEDAEIGGAMSVREALFVTARLDSRLDIRYEEGSLLDVIRAATKAAERATHGLGIDHLIHGNDALTIAGTIIDGILD